MLDLGTLRLGIKVESDSAKSELNKVGGEVEGTGSKVAGLAEKAKTMIKAFMAAYAVKEIVKLGKAALDAYAQFEQLEGGVKKLFGEEASKDVMKYAERAYQTAGMSANQYMDQVTSFSASLISSLDGDTKKAASVADMAIQDMSDNANVFGTDMTSIQNAYQGFAKQNYTMLDNLKLGFSGSKEGMQQLLDKAEEITGKKYDISNLSDVYEAIHEVQNEMNITGTTSREAASTIEGSTNMMKASWENMLTAMGRGEGVEKAMNQFLESIGTVAKNVGPVAVRIVVALAQALVTGIPKAAGMLGTFMSQLADNIGNDSGGKMGTAAGKLVTKLVQGLIQNVPTLVVGALKLVLALAQALLQAGPAFIQAGLQAMQSFISGFLQAHPQIASAVETIGKVFKKVMAPVKKIIDTVTKAWKTLMGQKATKKFSVSAPFSTAISSIKDVYNKWKDVLGQKASKTFSIVKSGFSSALESMKSIYNKWKDILAQKATKFFSIVSSGSVPSGPKKRIGLREVPYDGYQATLHKGETVLTAAETNRYKELLNAGEKRAVTGGNITLNVYGSDNMSVQDLAAAVERRLIQAQKKRRLAWQ